MGRGRDGAGTRRAGRAERPLDDVRHCAGCGRSFTWRPSLSADWEAVRWCSAACRRRGIGPVDRALERAIDELLDGCPGDGTICPTEAARRVDAARWEELREPARRAARRMVVEGTVEIVQDGRVADPSTAKGPIRLRRPRSVG